MHKVLLHTAVLLYTEYTLQIADSFFYHQIMKRLIILSGGLKTVDITYWLWRSEVGGGGYV